MHEAFTINAKKNYNCVLGSVKANIGHADSAAGVAGLIKVCKMLQEKIIPPQINYTSANEALDLEKTNFKIQTQSSVWTSMKSPLRAGVSSFGIGGTNAHVILEEYIDNKQNELKNDKNFLCIIPISAKSKYSYIRYCEKLVNYLESSNLQKSLKDTSFSLQTNRENFSYRGYVISSDKNDAIYQLQNSSNPINSGESQNALIFMFTGQGTQYPDMGKDLLDYEPTFKYYINKCCKMVSDITQVNFFKYIYPDNVMSENKLLDTQWAQPALFSIEFALAKLLESKGIYGTSYIGHSVGEYVAATLCGVFDLEDALKVIIKRGQLIQNMPQGSMISINAPYEKISEILPNNLEISVINSPEHVVVSGNDESVNSFKVLLDKNEILSLKLATSHAFHSHMMDKASNDFEEYLSKIKINKPIKTFVSNVTGKLIDPTIVISPKYWANHIRMPVQFAEGILTLKSIYPNAVFIEIGPGKGLCNFVNVSYKGKELPKTVQTLQSSKEFSISNKNDKEIYLSSIGKLWTYGYEICWQKIWNENADLRNDTELPTYAFEQKQCWVTSKGESKRQDASSIPIKTTENMTDIENVIFGVFFFFLGTTQLSKNDSYFDLGGNSLSAIRLMNKINRLFNLNLTPSVIFLENTVTKLARYLNTNSNKNNNKSSFVIEEGEIE